jgi:hypothetical protein
VESETLVSSRLEKVNCRLVVAIGPGLRSRSARLTTKVEFPSVAPAQ